eukprot:gene1548-32930_t
MYPPGGFYPPTYGMYPPVYGNKAPPSGSKAPPSGNKAPPSGNKAPPSGNKAPPTGKKAPPLTSGSLGCHLGLGDSPLGNQLATGAVLPVWTKPAPRRSHAKPTRPASHRGSRSRFAPPQQMWTKTRQAIQPMSGVSLGRLLSLRRIEQQNLKRPEELVTNLGMTLEVATKVMTAAKSEQSRRNSCLALENCQGWITNLRQLGLDDQGVIDGLTGCPKILTYSAGGREEENIEVLRVLEQAGLRSEQVMDVLQKNPAVLLVRPASLAQKLARLADMGFPPGSDGGPLMILNRPELLMLSLAVLGPMLEYVAWVSGSKETAVNLLTKQPSFLGKRPASIHAKLLMLAELVGCSPSLMLTRNYAIVTMGMRTRIGPRCILLKELGLLEDEGLMYKSTWLVYSNTQFATWPALVQAYDDIGRQRFPTADRLEDAIEVCQERWDYKLRAKFDEQSSKLQAAWKRSVTSTMDPCMDDDNGTGERVWVWIQLALIWVSFLVFDVSAGSQLGLGLIWVLVWFSACSQPGLGLIWVSFLVSDVSDGSRKGLCLGLTLVLARSCSQLGLFLRLNWVSAGSGWFLVSAVSGSGSQLALSRVWASDESLSQSQMSQPGLVGSWSQLCLDLVLSLLSDVSAGSQVGVGHSWVLVWFSTCSQQGLGHIWVFFWVSNGSQKDLCLGLSLVSAGSCSQMGLFLRLSWVSVGSRSQLGLGLVLSLLSAGFGPQMGIFLGLKWVLGGSLSGS